jgi:hypothetical protein
MVDFLIRDLAPDDEEYLRFRARQGKSSLSDAGKELIREARARDASERNALWAKIDLIRERIGPVPGDSTEIIREWRESR